MLANLDSNRKQMRLARGMLSMKLAQEVIDHTVYDVRRDDWHFPASARSKLTIITDRFG